jgi:hypothetical protein
MPAPDGNVVPLAVRVKNARYDGLITGYLHGGLKFTKTDPGGYRSASFVVDQRLGYRSDIIQPYSRIYVYNKRNGDTVFEGDVSHPGREVSDDGALLQVDVEGGVARLSDWSGARIFVDRDMQAFVLTNTTTNGTSAEPGEDRGGSGEDALTLAFPPSFHVETNYMAQVGYYRIREAGQQLGRFNYAWDGGFNSGAGGWLVQSIATPPSTAIRSQLLNTAGSGGSGAVVGGSIPVGANVYFMQLLWSGGPANIGVVDNAWASFLDPVVVARLRLKDGSFRTSGYIDAVTAVQVWEDLLGDMLAGTFDGPNAQLDAGSGYEIPQLAYPDGVTPQQVADDLMAFEPACTYIVGPSFPGVDKYTLKWMARTDIPRYEFITWTDDYSAGAQPVDQYNVAVTRWKSPAGVIKTTTSSTQSIPEMDAVGRVRRFFQDLTDTTSNATNATQANSTVLNDHRFPQNGGRITVSREVVDLYTGRRVQPYEIEPGYIARIVGVNPSRDALNNNPRNGQTLCRIISTDYDADSHSVAIELDSESWSLYRAIAKTKKTISTPQRRAI